MVAPSVKIENSLPLSQGEGLIRFWRDVVLGWSGGSGTRGMRLSGQTFPSLCVACDEPANDREQCPDDVSLVQIRVRAAGVRRAPVRLIGYGGDHDNFCLWP